jgi:hypothetical protein
VCVCVQVGNGGVEHQRPDGLLEGHAYSLICVREVPTTPSGSLQMLELRNPWGNQDEWQGASHPHPHPQHDPTATSPPRPSPYTISLTRAVTLVACGA